MHQVRIQKPRPRRPIPLEIDLRTPSGRLLPY